MNDLFAQFKQSIGEYNSFALVCHRRPDGDTIGSTLAFGAYLKSLGKSTRIYCVDLVPAGLKFLPGSELVKNELDEFWNAAPAVVLIDCGDFSMSNIPLEKFANKNILVIDHHVSNVGFGDINVVASKFSSTAEIVYNYLRYAGCKITKDIATNLLTGIYTDTDAFSNLGTTPESLSASSDLLKAGANFKEITAGTMRNKSITALKLWGIALERLRLDKKKGIAVTVIRKDDIAACRAEPEDLEGVANLLNHLADVKMAMVLREEKDGMVKGSLRTTNELVDVSKVAKLLGGGGHAKAAGFSVKGRIIESKNGWEIVE